MLKTLPRGNSRQEKEGKASSFQAAARIRSPGWNALPIAPSTDLEPRRGSIIQPERGRAAASPGSRAHPGPLAAEAPGGVPSGRGVPQTGARAWCSLLALGPACGHRP